MNLRKRLIEETQQLTSVSHNDLFHYINNKLSVNFMENTNGVFFLLNEICDEDIQSILDKITDIKKNDMKTFDIFHQENDVGCTDETTDGDNEEHLSNKSGKKPAFEYDKDMLNTVENYINKTNKKSIHLKYSNAKKKYNKQQFYQDVKKIDNTDLNELTEDTYIY